MNAKDVRLEMMRSTVVPGLRTLGWRGSAPHFHLPVASGDLALLSFQATMHTSPTATMFTFEIAHITPERLAERRAQDPSVPARPPAWFGQWAGGWSSRIGALLDPGLDRWWVLRHPEDAPAVAAEVLLLVRDVAMPHLLARSAGSPPPPPYPLDPIPLGDLADW
ncbi:hypothetical protein HP550_13485 [Cellulomonas humilata]|uniref:DUF4304 domain-containing protein n=1 Tax=Cellulomonas humilata TaxID=144055 RepID=A0A7Y6DYR2_9CELL|nr:hypothetical protein [Cellulomonas humilata]NUU18264.1 hypothetical protein [Cellulomonas humilata]